MNYKCELLLTYRITVTWQGGYYRNNRGYNIYADSVEQAVQLLFNNPRFGRGYKIFTNVEDLKNEVNFWIRYKGEHINFDTNFVLHDKLKNTYTAQKYCEFSLGNTKIEIKEI